MLLEGAGFSVQDEQQCIHLAKSTISALLPGFFDPSNLPEPSERNSMEPNLGSLKLLSRTIKSEVSLWIRRQADLHVVQGVPYVTPEQTFFPSSILTQTQGRTKQLAGLDD